MLDDILAAIAVEPHPDLVAATVPTNRDMLLAATVLGWLPDARWEPAVPA